MLISTKTRLYLIVSRVALILLGILLSLLVIEFLLSIFGPPNQFTLQKLIEEHWDSDDETLLHLKPNLDMQMVGHPDFTYSVITNSDGLREQPLVGIYPIAAIGDSFTYGFGVEEEQSWPTLLEDFSQIKVVNLGWAGFTSNVYQPAINRHAIPLQSHLWLWTFFINDLSESARAEEFIQSGHSDFKLWLKEENPNPWSKFPLNSNTVQFFASYFLPDFFALTHTSGRIVNVGQFKMRVNQFPWDMTNPENPDVQRGWELTELSLIETQALAVQNNATLVVIYIPSRELVYWPQIMQSMEEFDINQLENVELQISSIAKNNGIIYLNLLPSFRAAANEGKLLYFYSDGHWNIAGHTLAAREIYAFLLEEHLLEPPE